MNTPIQIIALAHFGSLLCRFLVLYFFEVLTMSVAPQLFFTIFAVSVRLLKPRQLPK